MLEKTVMGVITVVRAAAITYWTLTARRTSCLVLYEHHFSGCHIHPERGNAALTVPIKRLRGGGGRLLPAQVWGTRIQACLTPHSVLLAFVHVSYLLGT